MTPRGYLTTGINYAILMTADWSWLRQGWAEHWFHPEALGYA